MFAATRVAIAEFRVGFLPRSTGAAGARDFVALAVFFGLMSFLSLLSWSVRDGLWGRIEQLLLGALPYGNAPVRLGYHIDNVNKLNTNVIAAFSGEFPHLKLVPQRAGDGVTGPLVLPGTTPVSETAEGKANDVDEEVWSVGRTDRRQAELNLEAHPIDSPIWRWIADKAGPEAAARLALPEGGLTIALSRHLFREHFRYDIYHHHIASESLVPCELKQLLPEKLERVDELRHLILEVKENIVTDEGRRSTMKSFQVFDVIWVDSFPTPKPTAMIVPLSTYELLQASADRQGLDLQAETLAGASAGRYAQLRLADIDTEPEGVDAFHAMAACLGATPVRTEAEARLARADVCRPATPPVENAAAGGSRIATCEDLTRRMPLLHPRLIDNGQDLYICTSAHRRLRASEVLACAAKAGLPAIGKTASLLGNRLIVKHVPFSPKVEWLGPSRISAPCSALTTTDIDYVRAWFEQRKASKPHEPLAADWIETCAEAKAKPAGGADPPAELHQLGYQAATVYYLANEGKVVSLDEITKSLLGWRSSLGRGVGGAPVPIFRLDPSYESALTRFGVLSLIIERVSTPLAVGGLALYLFLTFVILSTAIDHRRRQYGLLMMNGIGPGRVGYIVRLQITLACLVGGITGYLVFELVARATDAMLLRSSVIAQARLLIGLDVPTFLPIMKPQIALQLWAWMTTLAILSGTILLRLQGITTAQAPIQLIKS